METGVEAKARLIKDAATRGEFGMKLCERHYYAHVEGMDELPEKIDQELDTLDNCIEQLEKRLAPKE